MNVFEIDRGYQQGRIQKVNAPQGSYVYELGHSLMFERNMAIGDRHQVESTFVREPSSLYVRATIIAKVPPNLPPLAQWEVSGWLNGIKMVSRALRVSKRPLVLEDWRISLANSNPPPATNTLAFRLELVGV